MAKPRNWCWTLNRDVDAWAVPTEAGEQGLVYCVFQMEVAPDTGRRHLQGYAEFNKPVRMSQAKAILGLDAAHFEPRRGSRDQARDYCMKHESREDGPWEFGEWTRAGQGKRTDLMEIADDLKEGNDIRYIVDNHASSFIRYHRGIKELHFELTRQKATTQMRKVRVFTYIGETGAGKTHRVYAWASRLKIQLYKLDVAHHVWWDGYAGERAILIDDFYGWIKYGNLLNILDRYPLRVEVKGGFLWANWTRIFITSNAHPNQWYKKGMTPALRRRLAENGSNVYNINPDTHKRELIDMAAPPLAPIFNNEYFRTVPNHIPDE